MSSVERKRWRRTSPLAAIFYLGRIFQAIAKNAVQSLAPLAAYLVATEGPVFERIVVAGSVFLVIAVVASLVRYWFFRYRITDDSILIREGVFRKTQLDIKFERIQAINTEQNVVYRLFDLVTVRFDTAGSARQEGHLPAVRTALADSLRQRIRHEQPRASDDSETEKQDMPRRELLALGPADIVRIGLSSNRALILLALLGPLLDQLEQKIGNALENSDLGGAADNAGLSVLAGVGVAAAVVMVVMLLLVIASILGAFLRYYGFRLVAEEDVLRSAGGLLTRHEQALNLAKIQTLEARQNPVLRLFDRFRLSAKQASSARRDRARSFVIPLCEPLQLPVIGGEVFRDEFSRVELDPRAARFARIAPRFVRSRVLLTGVLPAILFALPMSLILGPAACLALLWIPINALGVWLLYRRYGYLVDRDGFVLRRGLLGYRVSAFLHRKVQRISVTQTASQARKGLASMRFYLASGSYKLPYVDHELARRLRDYMLYRIESSIVAWH